MAGFRHITTQMREVLGNDRVDLSRFQVFQPGLKAGLLEVATRKSVIQKHFHKNDVAAVAVFPDNGLLRRDLSR